ncbi:hypothetical protein ES705_50835 [subsurface metagenome]
MFYSNTDGDVIELALGGANTFLKSTGTTSAPEFAAEADPTVDSDAEIKAILVDEVTKIYTLKV